jgi:hypothetical protein
MDAALGVEGQHRVAPFGALVVAGDVELHVAAPGAACRLALVDEVGGIIAVGAVVIAVEDVDRLVVLDDDAGSPAFLDTADGAHRFLGPQPLGIAPGVLQRITPDEMNGLAVAPHGDPRLRELSADVVLGGNDVGKFLAGDAVFVAGGVVDNAAVIEVTAFTP